MIELNTAIFAVGIVFFTGLLLLLFGSAYLVRGEVPRSERRGWQDLYGRRHLRLGVGLVAVSAPILVGLLIIR